MKELDSKYLRYSFIDFFSRVAAIVFLAIGFGAVYSNVSWNCATIIGSISILLAFLLAATVYYRHMRSERHVEKRPEFPISIIDSMAVLKILDAGGKRAQYIKNRRCCVEADTLSGYTERYLKADGKIDNISTGENAYFSTRMMPDGKMALDVFFKDTLKKGEIYDWVFSCLYLDSFTKDKEFFSTKFIYPTKNYSLTIEFPPDRPVKQAWVENSGLSGQQRPLPIDGLEIKKDNKAGITMVSVVAQYPISNSVQTIHWIW
jgi:hypothetical protein